MAKFDFKKHIDDAGISLTRCATDTLQINITKLCNQACHHCHVDSSPKRTEQMSLEGVEQCLKLFDEFPSLKNLDLTGGAPELNPHFDFLVEQATKKGIHVIVRHNLTVMIDGNPQTGESKGYLPEFYAKHKVEVVSSLPYYEPYFTDKQRGRGVFEKSIEALQRLNKVGYGKPESDLVLNLVYNPAGTFLPAHQAQLELDFKKELREKHGIEFNGLFTITNMPIHRFGATLQRLGSYDEYLTKLVNAFNRSAAENVMCRNLISVSYDGNIYDCDFNQMLEMPLVGRDQQLTIWNITPEKLAKQEILFDSHCFGCTAGQGSSCGGATA